MWTSPLSLGSWALRTGCQQNRVWQAAGLDTISIAINVSAKQFQNPLFVDYTPSRYFLRNPNGARTRGLNELLIEQTDAVVFPVRPTRPLKARSKRVVPSSVSFSGVSSVNPAA